MNQTVQWNMTLFQKEIYTKKTHPFFTEPIFFQPFVLLGRIRISNQKFMKFHKVGFYGRYKWNHNYDKLPKING